MLDTLPKTEDRYRGRARLMGPLATSIQISRSFSDPTLERLSQVQIDWAERFKDLHGKAVGLISLGAIATNAGNYASAFERFEAAERLIEDLPKKTIRSGFYRARGPAHLFSGDFQASNRDFRLSIEMYDQEGASRNAGGDTKVACLAMGAVALSLLGQFDQALEFNTQASELATEIGDPASLAFASSGQAFFYNSVGLTDECLNTLDMQKQLIEDYGLTFWRHWESAYRGRALLIADDLDPATAHLRQSLVIARSLGLKMGMTQIMGWLVEAQMRQGRFAEAGELLTQARTEAVERGEMVEMSNLLRLSGDLARQEGAENTEPLLALYRDAHALAQKQGAKDAELKAATALAEILHQTGEPAAAMEVLGRSIDSTLEGRDLPPYQAATTLLAELS